MENQDRNIKRAVSILKQNNSYFKKVYSASEPGKFDSSKVLDESGRFPFSFVVQIGDKRYWFKAYSNDPKERMNDVKAALREVQNLKIISGPLFSSPDSSEYDISMNSGQPFDDFSTVFDELNKIAAQTSTPSTGNAATSTSTPSNSSTEKTQTEADQNQNTEAKTWYIYNFNVADKTADQNQLSFTTAPTTQSANEYKLLLEFYGWSVKTHSVKAKSEKVEDLYPQVPNNAITPKTIKVAPGSKPKNYIIKFTWGPDNDKQSKTFLTKSTLMEPKSVNYIIDNFLMSKLTEDQKIKFINLTYNTALSASAQQGNLEFNQITPLILESESVGLEQPQSYRISFFDQEGDQHEIFTIKSTTPLDEYIEKLRMSGFHNIESDVIKKAGNVSLEDIDINFRSPKRDPSTLQKTMSKFKKLWTSKGEE